MGFVPCMIASSDVDGCIDVLIAAEGADDGSTVTLTMTKEYAKQLAEMILAHLEASED